MNETRRKVIVCKYESLNRPRRIAVGDVIRCSAFEFGFRFTGDKQIAVAWHSQYHPEYHARSGRGEIVNDRSRGIAAFLVARIELETNDGPDEFPDERRLCRKVHCIRLDEFVFSEGGEEICFALDEPMSVIRPDEDAIEILGYATLPIKWSEQGQKRDHENRDT